MKESGRRGDEVGGEKDLHLISNVDDEGIGDGIDSDPGVASPDLEARHVLVWEQEGQAARVRMGGQPEGEVGLRALGIEVHA